ncbi:hypothetical protein HDU87_006222 [Geranomyces variabilis]|uniref:Zn(2)-C6 fungal-type domain-containing protein n=1 Tax=Geranomyces variabilis TaxID=109894 RepID=A0AAD5XQP8_9FUNG|nr:hypothetical protein HDU87_006222 [Geranomyces variabilis]
MDRSFAAAALPPAPPSADSRDSPDAMLYASADQTNNGPASSSAAQTTAAQSAAQSRQFETAKRVRSAKTIWACDRCYRLKSKCDSGRPSCGTCVKTASQCSYTARERGSTGVARRGKRVRTVDAYVQMLEARLAEVEEIMKSRGPATLNGASVPHAYGHRHSPYDSSDRLHAQLYSSADRLYSHSGSSRQWQEGSQSPGYHPPFTEFSMIPSPSHPASRTALSGTSPILQTVPADGATDIFSPEVLRHLCNVYFEVCTKRWYNIPLHPKVFWGIPLEQHPPFLIYGLAAISAQYSNHPAITEYVRVNKLPGYRTGEAYFTRAKAMSADLTSVPAFETVIGMSILSMVAIRMGEPSATAYIAVAIRTAVEQMKLDTDPDVEEVHGSLSWQEKEARRRLWWSLCSIDGTDCAVSDRARIVAECDLPMFDRTPFFSDMSGRVKSPAPEILWSSLECADGLPPMGLFIPGRDLDCGEANGRLARIYARIRALGGAVSSIAQKATETATTQRRRSLDLPHTTLANASRHLAAYETEARPPPPPPFGSQVSTSHNPLMQISADQPHRRADVSLIEADLAKWKQSLPIWAQDISHATVFSANSYSHDPIPFQLLSLHVMFHSCHIALHLPALLRDPHHHSATYLAILQHTRAVTSLFQRGIAADPTAMYLPIFNCFFVFYPAVVVALALSDDAYSGHEKAEFKKEFHLYIGWMKVLGAKWYLGGYLVKVLEGIVDEWALDGDRDRE